MRGIINNIINFYQMQAKDLDLLVTNTQKALEQSEKERKANEQVQKLENFVKDLAMNLNNMLTKFHFLKERKDKRQEQLTEGQTKAISEFAIFVKTLTRNVSSLLKHFQAGDTFEEKIDKEIKKLEANVGRKLKEFDQALDESKASLTARLIQFARNITGVVGNLFQACSFVPPVANRRKSAKTSKKPAKAQDIEEDFSARSPNTNGDKLENLFNGLNIKSVENDEEKSEYLTHLKV
jgi:hypothetical protein